MRRTANLTALALAFTAAAAPAAHAQAPQGVRLEIRLAADSAPNGGRNPVVRSANLLSDDRWRTALHSGLPVRLHYRVEVWRSRDGWFDLFARQTEWDVVVRHEPLLDQYTLLTITGSRVEERRYATLDALEAALGFSYEINVRPSQRGEYYYSASLEIFTLSDSDLDELERFLEGDLGEISRERGGLGDALGRGATRLLLRLAGLPRVRLEGRSGAFRVR